jgi:acetyltransferase-like isoleucine patch superfamily enzyme
MMQHTGNDFSPISGTLKTSNSRALYFIIHLEICNPHRIERAAAIARTLKAGGHKLLITYEDQIAFRFAPYDTETHYWDARRGVASWKQLYPELELRKIDTWGGDGIDGLAEAQEKRASAIAELLTSEAPSHLIIWGGNFEYQLGTHEGVARAGYADRMIFCEVAWFPQQEFMYFDCKGVNIRSSLVDYSAPRLSPGQYRLLDAFRAHFGISRAGNTGPDVMEKSVFVPLQIESDTSFRLGSPFKTNAEFVTFLEDWLPSEYSATLKLHPKEHNRGSPVHTRRSNFRLIKAGSLDRMLLSASHVIGINSTTLLEAALLDKNTIAFGDGLFKGSGVLTEAQPDSDVHEILTARTNPNLRDVFLYELLLRRQVSLDALKQADYEHLASRVPFDEILENDLASDGKQRFLGKIKKGEVMIRVGKSRIAKTAVLDVEKGGEIIIGDDSEVRNNAVLEVSGRYNGCIQIGDHSVIGVGSWLQGSGKINIGDDVVIGPYAALVSTNHQYDSAETPVARQPLTTGEITIENDVWLGAHVTVGVDVRIGAHSIIGANSFVNKDIPPYSIAVGSPARVIRTRKP